MKRTLVLLMLALLPFSAFAQKDTRETQSQITYDVQQNGPQGGVQQNYDRAKVDEVVAQIQTARRNGDVQKALQLQNDLERVSGSTSLKSSNFNYGPQPINEVINEPVSETDYNLTIINSGDGNWATATATDRLTGRIYVAATKYNSAGSDSLKIFTSSNNGISWVLVNKISYAASIDFRNDELDIEAVNNGTTSYVFIVAGWGFSGVDYSTVYRLNSSGGEFVATNLLTAPAAASVRNIHPRITSDAAAYTSAAYVYVVYTQDSVKGANNHDLRGKFAILTSPFVASPVLSFRNNSSASFYWSYFNVQDTTMMYNDIVYSDSASTDQIIVASNFYRTAGFNNIYMAYSRDYGSTIPVYFPQITETRVNYKPRLACTGVDNVSLAQHIVLTYVRQFSATDWDPYYHRTSNNGSTWTGAFVDASTDTTVYSDVIAITTVPNKFRFAYTTSTSSSIGNSFLKTFNGALASTRFQLNTSPCAVNFSPVRAGYRLSATDSCFTIVAGTSGISTYAYSGCSGSLTGIGNSELPVNYKLSQNYPNPFNPVTKIAYALPKSGLVTLRVYNILGKEVATLVNEVKNVGSYSVDFNASNFTSGVYFYKLETNGFSDIKKMMLIK